jgi:hypothetical protein
MTDEAGRTPPKLRPTSTLQEIFSSMASTPPANRLEDDLARIERALARLEAAMRQAMRDTQR